jgi:hypothetical protein
MHPLYVVFMIATTLAAVVLFIFGLMGIDKLFFEK